MDVKTCGIYIVTIKLQIFNFVYQYVTFIDSSVVFSFSILLVPGSGLSGASLAWWVQLSNQVHYAVCLYQLSAFGHSNLLPTLLTFNNYFCHTPKFCNSNNCFPLFQQIFQWRISANIYYCYYPCQHHHYHHHHHHHHHWSSLTFFSMVEWISMAHTHNYKNTSCADITLQLSWFE
jgi:hypothetical protein